MITVGSLCTGIGLIDLGLEWAGLGPVLWQVEILPERRAVLEHWWPGVARYDDVRTVTGLPYVDCIAFGSPCKNLSSAGDRSGLDGPQSRLFFDCLRVVEEVRPTLTSSSYGSNQGGSAGRTGPIRKSLAGLAGGSLSPTWCEWFMGAPIDWTAPLREFRRSVTRARRSKLK